MRTFFAEFVLDSETRQLTRDGQDIHLSPKAFAVLSVLLAKRPRVVPKADLFGEIWPDVFVVDANLNVAVGEIRRAIDDDPQSPVSSEPCTEWGMPSAAAPQIPTGRRPTKVHPRCGSGSRGRITRSCWPRATTSSAGILDAKSGWTILACQGATRGFESSAARNVPCSRTSRARMAPLSEESESPTSRRSPMETSSKWVP